jgi:hypothetical protein
MDAQRLDRQAADFALEGALLGFTAAQHQGMPIFVSQSSLGSKSEPPTL